MAHDAVRAPDAPRRLRAPALDPGLRRALRDAAVALAVSRALVAIAGWLAVAVFGESRRAADFDPAGVTDGALAAPFARWDSVWFLAIANDGYGDGAREAFFPLYPLLVHVAGVLTGSPLWGGALLSTGLFYAALVALHRLVEADLGPRVARGAVLAVAFFPMSFFFSAVYSEALFLALSVGAFLAARHERWLWAAGLAALAAATRSAGILLVVPLVLFAWRARAAPRDVASVAVLPPLGLAAYVVHLALAGLDPGAPFAAQEVWFREFAGPFLGVWDALVAAVQGARQLLSGAREPVYFTAAGGDPLVVARHNLALFGWLVLLVPAVVGTARRLPLAWSAYVVAALALPLSYPVGPQPLMSLPRFVAVLFPLFVWVALWADGGRWRGRMLLALGTAGLVVYAGIFATFRWVA